MNKKGFTLVELLVVITILGIITMLSLPLLRGVEEKNENRKINTYSKSVESSVKLYVDSYAEDLFGHDKSGCAYVKYSDLKKRNLIKDIEDTNLSCDTDSTFIRVVKLNNQYAYSVYLGCGQKAGDTVSKVSISYPEKNQVYEPDPTACAPGKSNIVISASGYVNPAVFDKKRRTAKVTLTSPTGLNNSPIIYYAWRKDTNYGAVTDWKKIDFRIPGGQENKILAGETIETTSGGILTPENGDGEYRLLLKVERLEDIVGKPWNNPDGTNSQYINFAIYSVDGIPPVIESLTANSTSTEFNKKEIKINLKGSDNHTPSKDLKVCISESKTGCDKGTYKNYTETLNYTVSGDYDGKSRTIYVSLKDKGGNVAQKSVNYTIYKNCTQTKDDGNWTDKTTCTKKCGTGTKVQESAAIDKFTSVKCPTAAKFEKTVNCNTQTCCSKTKDEFGSWSSWSGCSKACGGGTQTRTRTVTKRSVYDNSVCSTQPETASQSCQTQDCCSSIREEFGNWSGWSGCSKSCGGGTQTRTRTVTKKSTYDSRVCGTRTETGSQSCNTHSCLPAPSIYNPTNGNWTRNDFSLVVSTTASASDIGYWYYSYDNANFTRYDSSNADSYGKTSFTTSRYSAERNSPTYIRYCNKSASGPNDSANCSPSSSTYIRIDKTAPSVSGKKVVWNSGGVTYSRTLRLTYSDSGSGVGVRSIWTSAYGQFPAHNCNGASVAEDYLQTTGCGFSYSGKICDAVGNCRDHSGSVGWC